MRSYFFTLLLGLSFVLSLHAKADLFDTLGIQHFGERNTGEVAVNKAIALVAHIFLNTHSPNISLFLKRIAKAESDFGRHHSTFRKGYYGGIWQVDRVGFEETKNVGSHPNLAKLHDAIKAKFSWGGLPGVDWEKTTWEDCIIPAYSCVAARLYLSTIPERIPDTLEEQARYWKKYYNTPAGDGTVQHFIDANRGDNDEL